MQALRMKNTIIVDLHTHTTASDGVYSPIQLIDLAVSKGVRTLAITDHDTVAGLPEALNYAAGIGFHLIPGIEFSIDYPNGSFHLVGLHIDHAHEGFIEATRWLVEERGKRIEKICDDLTRNGINVLLDEVLEEGGGESLGRPHVARVLIRKGYARDMAEVFQNYMVKGRPGYVKKAKIPFAEAISLINQSGGIPVVAHPVSLNFSSFRAFVPVIESMIDAGVRGIEVFASMHRDDEVEQFLEIAEMYGLAVSGGSDFHGDKQEELGYYGPGKLIPADILDPIIRAR